jgi:hypothetical protein
VNSPDKPDPARGWMSVEELLAEDEAKRVEKLSDAELHAEMRREGMDPARVPSGEELLARVAARAAARAARQGAGSVHVAPAAPVVPNAPVVPIDRAKPSKPSGAPRRLVWLLAAAFVVAVLIVGALKGPAIVAYFRGPPIGPDVEGPYRPSPRELAEKLRDDAMGHCAQASWATCKAKLDEAAALDPAGESEARVVGARWEIENAGKPVLDASVMPQKPGH